MRRPVAICGVLLVLSASPVAEAQVPFVHPPLFIAAYASPGQYTWQIDGIVLTSCPAEGCDAIEIVPIYRLRFGDQLVPQFAPTIEVDATGGPFGTSLPPDAVDFRLEATQSSCNPSGVCGTSWTDWPGCFAGECFWHPLAPVY